jgi:hypothetical protein
VSRNRLRQLPLALGSLAALAVLRAQSNKFFPAARSVPAPALAGLRALRELDLRFNAKLKPGAPDHTASPAAPRLFGYNGSLVDLPIGSEIGRARERRRRVGRGARVRRAGRRAAARPGLAQRAARVAKQRRGGGGGCGQGDVRRPRCDAAPFAARAPLDAAAPHAAGAGLQSPERPRGPPATRATPYPLTPQGAQ